MKLLFFIHYKVQLFNINSFDMKNYKSKALKTEGSLERQDLSKRKNDWIFHSVLKNKKKPTTPLRFADFINRKDKDVGSTNDR